MKRTFPTTKNRSQHLRCASRGAVLGLCVLLALTVFLVFGPALRHDFVNFDDEEYFSTNPHVQTGLTWPGVKWAFSTTYASNWHPLTWLSLMVDVKLFGPGPLGPHLTNVLLHAVNTVLVFLLLRRLTGAQWRSAFVAALFGLHPLHVESVAWVSERKDVLSASFGLLTLLMYARYAEKHSRVEGRDSRAALPPAPSHPMGEGGPAHVGPSEGRWKYDYWVAILFFAMGLMSKPMLVTLPFVMLLLDYWPLRRFELSASNFQLTTHNSQLTTHNFRLSILWRLILEKLPFLALSVASSLVTLLAQRDALQPLTHIAMSIRAVNTINSYARYLGQTFWPLNLAIPYPHPGYGTLRQICASGALLVAVTFAVMHLRRKFPFLVTGWFWYLGMLIPVIGLVQVGMQAMADRYTYLPLIGLFIMLVWGCGEAFERRRLGKAAAWGAAGLILAACAARSRDQLRYWENSETLFQRAISVTKYNDIAYYNLGEYYLKTDRLDEAMDNFRKAIQIRPDYDDALNNLGVALALKGQLDEALARIRQAIHYEPGKADAYYNLGNVFVRQRNLDAAAGAFAEALRLKPDYPEAHNNLATTLLLQGHRAAAIEHYREALRLNPKHEVAKRQLQALGALPPE